MKSSTHVGSGTVKKRLTLPDELVFEVEEVVPPPPLALPPLAAAAWTSSLERLAKLPGLSLPDMTDEFEAWKLRGEYICDLKTGGDAVRERCRVFKDCARTILIQLTTEASHLVDLFCLPVPAASL